MKIQISHPTDIGQYSAHDDTSEAGIAYIWSVAEAHLEAQGYVVEVLPPSVEGYWLLDDGHLLQDSRWGAERWAIDLVGGAYAVAIEMGAPE